MTNNAPADNEESLMKVEFKPVKASISLPIREVTLGIDGKNALSLGKTSAYPFVSIDGDRGHKTRIAVEIHDELPEKYPVLLETSNNKAYDPVKEALDGKSKGANLVALRITGAKQSHKPAKELINLAQTIIAETNLPLVILGINNRELDRLYLPALASGLAGQNCLIGPVEEETYKDIVPAIRDNGHCVIARTPIDINLAKQLNILITDTGLSPDRIVIDPNMGGLGYGLDYAYSVVEKIRIAAFEGDKMLNMPIAVFSGEETWRCKEAKSDISDELWGDNSIRAASWENLTTASMILTGVDLVIMRYTESISYISRFLKD
jgi:acetyl-CoA decarbonylase/synthase complex subunit delta